MRNSNQEEWYSKLIDANLLVLATPADRIAVIYEGQIIGAVQRNDATPQKPDLLMAGVKEGV